MNIIRTLLPGVVVLAVVAASASACGDDQEQTVEIVSPTEGQVVSVPFEVTLESSTPLGSSDLGHHHVHIWFGDNQDAYLVVEGELTQVTSAPDGEQVMHVSLRNADHSEAGAEDSVSIVISGGTSE